MPNPSEGISYSMYEEYYAHAKSTEAQGRIADAKRLYLSAAEALYSTARTASGGVRTLLMDRAQRLEALSDAIKSSVPAPPAEDSTASSTPAQPRPATSAAADQRPRRSTVREDGGSNAVFVPASSPNVHFDDIAGLDDVKEAVNTRIILPRKYPEVYKAYKRSLNGGILLYGPPGTGKSMIAKAIATEIDATFYSIRCSDVVDKYVGDSEKNIKALFEAARAQQSAILFFDEFEALAARRGGDATVMNRLVPELLSQIDGFNTSDNRMLLLLAASNRPWDLDTAFLRPPRLTDKIYVGLPDMAARRYLVGRKFDDMPCAQDFTLDEVAELTDGFNAADVAEFCEAMKDGAIHRTLFENNGQQISQICRDDMLRAAQRVHSSVQQEDVLRIQEWEKRQGKGD